MDGNMESVIDRHGLKLFLLMAFVGAEEDVKGESPVERKERWAVIGVLSAIDIDTAASKFDRKRTGKHIITPDFNGIDGIYLERFSNEPQLVIMEAPIIDSARTLLERFKQLERYFTKKS